MQVTHPRYLSEPKDWARLNDYLLKQREVGLDTEGVGYKEAGPKQVTVWSIAAFNGKQSPRGYAHASGYVLPAEALHNFKPLLESEAVVKWLHNAPADTGGIYDSTGIVVNAARCTLQYSRVAMPGLDAYGLKPLASKVLGKPYRPDFAAVTGYEHVELVSSWATSKTCACGVEKCRKRVLPMHEKAEVSVETVTEKRSWKEYSPADMHPGHERWLQWVDYALEDAVDALELASYLTNLKRQNPGDPYSEAVQAFARSNKWKSNA